MARIKTNKVQEATAPETTPAPAEVPATGKGKGKKAAAAAAPAPEPEKKKGKRGGSGGARYTGKVSGLNKTDYFIRELVENEKPKNRVTDEVLRARWNAEFPPDCKYSPQHIRVQFNRRSGTFTKVAQLHPDVTSHAYDEKKKPISKEKAA